MTALERNLNLKQQQQQKLSQETLQQQSQLMGQLEDQLYSVKLRLNSQAERILQLGTASQRRLVALRGSLLNSPCQSAVAG